MSNKKVKFPLPKGGVRKADILEVGLVIASNRGENTRVYNISKKSPLVTYTIVTSASSERRCEAIAHYAEEALEEAGYKVDHVEGKRGSSWILVDAGIAVVHVFTREERERVNIDELYRGCLCTPITEDDVKAYVSASAPAAK